jgi:ABC-type sugar transport system substrate-binding protein
MSLGRLCIYSSALVAAVAVFTTIDVAPARAQQRNILFVAKTFGNQYFREMEEGVRAAAARNGKIRLEVRAGTREDDVSGQRRIIETFISRHSKTGRFQLSGVILTPGGSSTELTGVIKKLNDLSIPVVILDTEIAAEALTKDHATITTFIGSDNIKGGNQAAQLMCKLVPKKEGTLLLLNGVSGQATAAQRREGFLNGLKDGTCAESKYKVQQWTANWVKREALTAVTTLLAGGTQFDGIFGANDQMALGAAEAVRTRLRGNSPRPIIIGYDAVPEARKAIQSGLLTASLAQKPKEMGSHAIDALQAVWDGKKVEPVELIPVTPILKN